jgi:hypothetical protein
LWQKHILVVMILTLFFLLPIIAIIAFLIWEFHAFVLHISPEKLGKETIILHFIHGSVPKIGCSDQRIRLGGKWGGHVEIEIDEHLYSFEIRDRTQKVPLWNTKKPASYNAIFFKTPKEKWLKDTENDKITSIILPLEYNKKATLLSIYQAYLEQLPYNYTFLGMRCTASAHYILAEIGLFRPCSKLTCIATSFYPKMLRRKALAFSKQHNFTVLLKEGIVCRDWE